MEAIFTLHSSRGKAIPLNPEDYEKYLLENEGQDLYVTMRPLAKTSEKMRMYAFLFGPLMTATVNGFVQQGYHGIDRVQARYKLQAEFAKKELYNAKTKKTEITLEDLSGMTKPRLLQFLIDCCMFIENDLGQKIPDSAEWKAKLSGTTLVSVKHKKAEKAPLLECEGCGSGHPELYPYFDPTLNYGRGQTVLLCINCSDGA